MMKQAADCNGCRLPKLVVAEVAATAWRSAAVSGR